MKKILLVNASRYFFDEGKSLLDRKDFQVFMAPSGARALEIHRQERANLIVTDLDLQDMGGDTLCHSIRTEPESKVVSFILICHDTPSDLARCKKSGANICLHKPFSAKTLLEHVEKLLSISTRRGYRVLLRAQVKGAKDDSVFFCTSQNLSASGILIETDRDLATGDLISCSFFLPGAAQITTDGEVARMETAPDGKHICGIRFINIPAEQKRAIENFIADSIVKPH
jgi:DNA-binding response OmpR family regulator